MNEVSRTALVSRKSILLDRGEGVIWASIVTVQRENSRLTTEYRPIHVGLGLFQETERPKVKAKLSKHLEKVYLALPFSFNLFRFEAETSLFASFLTSHTLSSVSIQEHSSSNLDDREGPPLPS